MAEFKVGVITHYYQSIGVAMLKLNTDLGKGDEIVFVSGDIEIFRQKVDYLQVGFKKQSMAKMGELVGIKTAKEVNEGVEVFKIQES